jgi:hypothetical protein
VYRTLRTGSEWSELIAVNVNPFEGDIRQLDIVDILDILRPLHQSLETTSNFAMSSEFVGVRSLSDWLLYAVLLFLLAEILLAGRILQS